MNGSTRGVPTTESFGVREVPEDQRILSRKECEAVWERVRGFARGEGEVLLQIGATWAGELRWARNRASLASDRREIILMVERNVDGHMGEAIVNQIDDASLEAAVRYAERLAKLAGTQSRWDFVTHPPTFTYSTPAIWSEATRSLTTEARAQIARAAIDPAEAERLLAAGYLQVRIHAVAKYNDPRGSRHSSGYPGGLYTQYTFAQCSTTIRDHQGAGSGWAGLTSYDWGAIDYRALAERALQKALASRNPVAIEPGRYTVILEPQAVHDLVTFLIAALSRFDAELPSGPFALGPDPALRLGRSKLGLKVVDERITIDHDPMDPLLGVVPWDRTPDAAPHRKVTWIERGRLVALEDDRRYALATRNDNLPYANSYAFRMSGGETSLEDMIRTTKRGLLVSRFSNTRLLHRDSLLTTGVTRDGLWLIENGQITKAVKNLRFTESPLFVLNSIEQLGVPVPVFRITDAPLTPAIVPPLKARDFSFTSAVDAI